MVNAKVLHDLWSVESVDAELWIQRADYIVTCRFLTMQRIVTPYPCIVQGLTVIRNQQQKDLWKIPKYWKLSNILLNEPWVKEESKGKKYFELNVNENTTYPNLWDVSKAVCRGNFIALKCLYQEENALNLLPQCLP